MAERNPPPGPAPPGSPVGQREGLLDRLPLKEGGLVGAGAFVAGLLATVALKGSNVAEDEPLLRFSQSGSTEFETASLAEIANSVTPPSSFELGGWFYHEAHFAPVTGEVTGGEAVSEQAAVEFIGSVGIALLVPLVVIAAAGYLLVGRNPASTPADAATAGATVVAGYAPAALASTFVLSWEAMGEFGSTISVQPDLVTALLVTGIVYPAVVGAAGGYFWHYRSVQAPAGGAYGGKGYQRGGYQLDQPPSQQGRNRGGQSGQEPPRGTRDRAVRSGQQQTGLHGRHRDRRDGRHAQRDRTGGRREPREDRQQDP